MIRDLAILIGTGAALLGLLLVAERRAIADQHAQQALDHEREEQARRDGPLRSGIIG